MGMHHAEAFRAEIERLKPLILSGESFATPMPAALAQARAEVIAALTKRPSLSLSQIGDLADAVAYARQFLGEEKACALLDALRAELNKEDAGCRRVR